MIALTLIGISNLNNSLQVGDMIYAVTTSDSAPEDLQGIPTTGVNQLVGILRRITVAGTTIVLDVEDNINSYIPQRDDFIMFSKYDQTDGDVNGYYAEAKFENDSKVKAELFSVGSEIIINSK
tara:strand:- start:1588 stop:1956 length:369 start_codon:yes stop_codon:yes gene_type:complete